MAIGAHTSRDGPGEEDGAPWLFRALVLLIPVVVVASFWYFAQEAEPPRRVAAHGQAQTAMPAQPPAAASGEQAHLDGAQMEQAAMRLAARLEREPNDANGWGVLGRTWYVLGRFPQAVAAYEKRVALGAPDADLLADYADALAMAQGGTLQGKPLELVRQALRQNPSQWKALSMAATDAFQRNDHRAAIDLWQRALVALPPGSEMAAPIEASLAQARRAVQAR